MSWWDIPGKTCIAAYQALAADTLAASYVNWANPGTYDLTLGVVPLFTRAAGWDFDGATMYLKTGYTAIATACMSVRFSALGNLSTAVCGALEAGGGNGHFYIAPTVDNKVEYAHGTNEQQAPGITSGVLGVGPLMGYRNGVPDCVLAAFEGTGREIYIGAWNGGGVAANFAQVLIQAFAIHLALTAGEFATLHAAMAAIPGPVARPDTGGGVERHWSSRRANLRS